MKCEVEDDDDEKNVHEHNSLATAASAPTSAANDAHTHIAHVNSHMLTQIPNSSNCFIFIRSPSFYNDSMSTLTSGMYFFVPSARECLHSSRKRSTSTEWEWIKSNAKKGGKRERREELWSERDSGRQAGIVWHTVNHIVVWICSCCSWKSFTCAAHHVAIVCCVGDAKEHEGALHAHTRTHTSTSVYMVYTLLLYAITSCFKSKQEKRN